MKVLIVGRSRRTSAEWGVRRALERRGHRVAIFDDIRVSQALGRRAANLLFEAWARHFSPELVIVAKALAIGPDVLGRICAGRRSVLWYHDLRIPPDPEIVARARQVDILFLPGGGQAEEHERMGVRRALFLPEAADADLHVPVDPDPAFASDVAFIGSAYDEYRVGLLTRLRRRFDLRTWGPGWERWREDVGWAGRAVDAGGFARVCASARIVIGIHPGFQVRSPVWGYASDRMWKVVSCGGFYLGHATPGLRELLRDEEHCAWYDDEDHLFAQIERYLEDDAARDRIRAAGRHFVARHHTFDQRVENLLTGTPFRNPLEAVANPLPSEQSP